MSLEILRRFFGKPKATLEQIASATDPVEGDRAVLDQLRELGADLTQPRDVRHYLYFPSHEAASTAAARLKGEGFTVDVTHGRGTGDDNWLVFAVHTARVDASAVADLRARLTDLAASLGGTYDGWEASPKP